MSQSLVYSPLAPTIQGRVFYGESNATAAGPMVTSTASPGVTLKQADDTTDTSITVPARTGDVTYKVEVQGGHYRSGGSTNSYLFLEVFDDTGNIWLTVRSNDISATLAQWSDKHLSLPRAERCVTLAAGTARTLKMRYWFGNADGHHIVRDNSWFKITELMDHQLAAQVNYSPTIERLNKPDHVWVPDTTTSQDISTTTYAAGSAIDNASGSPTEVTITNAGVYRIEPLIAGQSTSTTQAVRPELFDAAQLESVAGAALKRTGGFHSLDSTSIAEGDNLGMMASPASLDYTNSVQRQPVVARFTAGRRVGVRIKVNSGVFRVWRDHSYVLFYKIAE